MLGRMQRFCLVLLLAILSSQISPASVSFKPVQSIDVGTVPTSVAIADLNGDRKPDLAVALAFGGTDNQGSIAILFGNGDGTFIVSNHVDSQTQ